jgi:hypothetical protein
MRLKFLASAIPLVVAAALAAGSLTGCAPHRNDYYDSVNNDHHSWNSHEEVVYRGWETNQHMDHVTFNRRAPAEQNAYWSWRHQHPD